MNWRSPERAARSADAAHYSPWASATCACCLLAILAVAAHDALAEGAADTNHAKPPDASGLAPADLALQVGERLLYDIRVNGVPAGKALLEVRRTEALDSDKDRQVWIIEMHVRSNRAMSLLYDVNTKARSRIDVKGGFSRFFNIERKEGETKAEETVTFTYDIGGMEAVCKRVRPDGLWRAHKVPLTGKALDPLSALYYLRSVDLSKLQPGDVIPLPICADRRLWNTPVRVVNRWPSVDAGCVKGRECVEVEPEAEFRGLFERKGVMRVWLDVATRIPLKMTVEIPIGPAEVVLTEATSSPLPSK